MIKNLADLKRLPVGTKLLCVQGGDKKQGTVRAIDKKQTNAIKFEGGSWLEYPKAHECTFQNGSIFIVQKNDEGQVWSRLEYQVYNN